MVDPLNIESLAALLDAAGVDPSSYRLDGAHYDECIVLAHGALRRVPGGWLETWTVFSSERGKERGRRTFETEDEACRYMLRVLLPTEHSDA